MARDPRPHELARRTPFVLALLAVLAGCSSASAPSPAATTAASAEPPASVAPVVGPTPSAGTSPSATLAPSPTPASTPAPAATRAPRTQADPPIVALRVGDWVTVVTSSLKVRAAAGLSAARVATLVSGEIAYVTQARKTVDGYDWYGVSTLAAPRGWVASGTAGERFLKYLNRETFVSWCGKVKKTDPVVVGSRVVPAKAVDRFSLGVLRMVEAVEGTGCLAVVRDGDGLAVRVDAGTIACGAPRWDGAHLSLAPTLAGNVVPQYRVRTTTGVADALLTQDVTVGPEGRTNLQNVLILASRAPAPFGCVHSWVKEDEAGERQLHVMTDSVQCVVATERDADSIHLRSSGGGDVLWFGLQGSTSIDGSLRIGQPAAMNVTAALYPQGDGEFFSLVANTVPGCGG